MTSHSFLYNRRVFRTGNLMPESYIFSGMPAAPKVLIVAGRNKKEQTLALLEIISILIF